MAGYSFFPPADKAQDDIWKYTVKTWGRVQAEKYILGLHEHLQQLADRQKNWQLLPKDLVTPSDLDIQAYFSRYEYHFIFFREFSNGDIGVMSILHGQADIPVRLKTDLDAISRHDV